MKVKLYLLIWGLLLLGSSQAQAQQLDVRKRLNGFDKTVAQMLKEWNVPGCAVAVVVKDKLVFAQG